MALKLRLCFDEVNLCVAKRYCFSEEARVGFGAGWVVGFCSCR